MPIGTTTNTTPRGGFKPRRRAVPWWALFWPPHVQLAVSGTDRRDLDHAGAVPAYGGGPGLAYRDESALAIADRPLTSQREWPLGFGITVYGEGVTVPIVAQPQVIFRGERLVIPSFVVAQGLGVVDIKVGNRSQLANSGILPASLFEESAVGVRLSMDTAVIAQDVVVVIKDLSGAGGVFLGAIVGTAMF